MSYPDEPRIPAPLGRGVVKQLDSLTKQSRHEDKLEYYDRKPLIEL